LALFSTNWSIDMKDHVQVTTRVSGELAADLLTMAAQEKRSLSNILVLAIEDFVAKWKADQQKSA
jgi:predicted transcriptional regulator